MRGYGPLQQVLQRQVHVWHVPLANGRRQGLRLAFIAMQVLGHQLPVHFCHPSARPVALVHGRQS
jgi:hypothetical protein